MGVGVFSSSADLGSLTCWRGWPTCTCMPVCVCRANHLFSLPETRPTFPPTSTFRRARKVIFGQEKLGRKLHAIRTKVTSGKIPLALAKHTCGHKHSAGLGRRREEGAGEGRVDKEAKRSVGGRKGCWGGGGGGGGGWLGGC